MASWCKKCVYLKPKLEKLAADYYPSTLSVGVMKSIKKFQISLGVNNVPHKFVVRARVTVISQSYSSLLSCSNVRKNMILEL
ncbi:hypothetical protein CsSME_00033287 [Camellia sinensis var. sinensis]